MKVLKRDGTIQEISFDAIKNRILELCFDTDTENLNIDQVVIKTVQGMYNGITTRELDNLSAVVCASLEAEHYGFVKLAGRILVNDLHKELRRIFKGDVSFSNKIEYIQTNLGDYFDKDFYNYVINNKDELNKIINSKLDYTFTYFGFKTLERAYLTRVNNIIIESPQDMWLRVAVSIHYKSNNIDLIKQTYELMADGYFTHATPTLFNAGCKYQQLSSCYLLGTEDSLTGIYKNISDCAAISKWAGGIGIHVSNIRAQGSRIKSTNGKTDGIIPMLKVYNETARYVNQCFTPDTVIYTNNGPCEISCIALQDKVITTDNTFKQVVDVIKNPFNGNIYKINTQYCLDDLKCTGVHDIFILDHKDNKMKFKQAKDLTLDDHLIYSIPNEIIDNDLITIDDCKMYGMILKDIIMFYDHSKYNQFLVKLNEEDYKWLSKYVDDQKIAYWFKNETKKEIIFTNSNETFLSIFTLDEDNKLLFDYTYLNLSNEKLMSLLSGLLSKEIHTKEDLYNIKISNTNKHIIESLRYILLRLGIVSYGKFTNKIYELYTNNNNDVLKIENKLCVKITDIKQEHYEGYVYDLTIDTNHNYMTSNGLVHNSGKRNGSIAVYLEPWHADIWDFVELKKNTGVEQKRARDLFLALWIPDLFMKMIETDGDWYLMCPSECPNLQDTYGEEFEKLYNQYINEKKYRKVIKAQTLWRHIIESQIETGNPYILFKDHCNRKSNQKNIGTIKSSNLCAEIIEYSDNNEYSVCNLASISLVSFVKEDYLEIENLMDKIDWLKLEEVSKIITRNLDKIIDINFYPTNETKKSNLLNRPIGIGIQGFGNLLCKLNIPYESNEALLLSSYLMECIYYGCITQSIELSIELGSYDRYNNSPFSQGILQFDMWDDKFIKYSGRYNWNLVKENLIKYGIRNSLLTALMPTASTSQILGNTECFEPFSSNIFKRTTLAGEFMVVNQYLMSDLMKLGLWNKTIQDKIFMNDGSIQNIPEIPLNIKNIYKTIWEIKQKAVVDHALYRGPYIDQSQSMNLFFDIPNYNKLSSALIYGWKNGIKTGCYYLRSKPAKEAIKFSLDVSKMINKKEEIKKDEICDMCSA